MLQSAAGRSPSKRLAFYHTTVAAGSVFSRSPAAVSNTRSRTPLPDVNLLMALTLVVDVPEARRVAAVCP
jgi:hypothetical protein